MIVFPQSGVGRFRAALTPVILLFVTACSTPPDEQAIADTIAAIAQGVEDGSVGDIMTPIAEDFGTEDGRFDRAGLRRFAIAQTRLNRNIGVTMTGLEVNVEGDRSSTEFRALITGGNGRFIPERGRLYDVRVGLRRDGGDWEVINADWAPVFGE